MAWTSKEDENLCTAWGLVHTSPPINVNDHDYWTCVFDNFHGIDVNETRRGLFALSDRFKAIWEDIEVLLGLVDFLRVHRTIISDDNERKREAIKLYETNKCSKFEFKSCLPILEPFMVCDQPNCVGMLKLHTGMGNASNKWISFAKCSFQSCPGIRFLHPFVSPPTSSDNELICVKCLQYPCYGDCSNWWLHHVEPPEDTMCLHCLGDPCMWDCANDCDCCSRDID